MRIWVLEAGLRRFQEVCQEAKRCSQEVQVWEAKSSLLWWDHWRWLSLMTWSLNLKSLVRRWTSRFCDQNLFKQDLWGIVIFREGLEQVWWSGRGVHWNFFFLFLGWGVFHNLCCEKGQFMIPVQHLIYPWIRCLSQEQRSFQKLVFSSLYSITGFESVLCWPELSVFLNFL